MLDLMRGSRRTHGLLRMMALHSSSSLAWSMQLPIDGQLRSGRGTRSDCPPLMIGQSTVTSRVVFNQRASPSPSWTSPTTGYS